MVGLGVVCGVTATAGFWLNMVSLNENKLTPSSVDFVLAAMVTRENVKCTTGGQVDKMKICKFSYTLYNGTTSGCFSFVPDTL